MNYHAHLTVPDNTVVPKGWKRTDIILEGDRVQQDVMLTKHYQLGARGIENVNSIIGDVVSLDLKDLLRIKIEQDDGFTLPISEDNYAEIHMLCPVGVIPNGEGWVMSKNPRREGAHFFNRRIYSAPSMEEVIAETVIEQAKVPWIDLKIEQAIFDSNRNHDKWWA